MPKDDLPIEERRNEPILKGFSAHVECLEACHAAPLGPYRGVTGIRIKYIAPPMKVVSFFLVRPFLRHLPYYVRIRSFWVRRHPVETHAYA
jgi:hypothetical protein